jgi:AcrR family transcriptional regulator
MSKISSATCEQNPDLRSLLGGPVRKLELDHREVAAAVLSARARGEIVAAAKEAGVGVRELARRLGVSAAAVSRHLRSDGDMRLSTAALFADALGYEWQLALVPLTTSLHDRRNSERCLEFEVDEAPTLSTAERRFERSPGVHDQEQQLAA